jgi:hypothetical protein
VRPNIGHLLQALDPNIPQTESRRTNPESMATGSPIAIVAHGMTEQKVTSVSARYRAMLGGSPGKTDTDCGDVLFGHFLVIHEGNCSPSKGVWETLTKQDET